MSYAGQPKATDEAAISHVINLVGLYLDDKTPERFEELFTNDVLFISAGNAVDGIQAMIAYGTSITATFERLHHVITNIIVDIDADKADARANMVATHIHRANQPHQHFDVGAVFHLKLRREEGIWKIFRGEVVPVWTNGSFEAASAGE